MNSSKDKTKDPYVKKPEESEKEESKESSISAEELEESEMASKDQNTLITPKLPEELNSSNRNVDLD